MSEASKTGPEHYKITGVEPWDAMEAWLSREEFIGFLKGNAIKYLARSSRKGQHDEDLKKAEHYLRKLNEVLAAEDEPLAEKFAEFECSRKKCRHHSFYPVASGEILHSIKHCQGCGYLSAGFLRWVDG